jgi:hypothetical protein
MERERVTRMFPGVLLRHNAIVVSDVPRMVRMARAVDWMAVVCVLSSHRSTAFVKARLRTGVASCVRRLSIVENASVIWLDTPSACVVDGLPRPN